MSQKNKDLFKRRIKAEKTANWNKNFKKLKDDFEENEIKILNDDGTVKKVIKKEDQKN